jgi:hypothetical protein
MVYPLSYQLYKQEHGLTAAEQRAADVRAGESAAALRLRRRVRPACGAADTITAQVRFLSSAR